MRNTIAILFILNFGVTHGWSQIDTVDIIPGDSISIPKQHPKLSFEATNIIVIRFFATLPDLVSADLDSITLTEDGTQVQPYVKLRLDEGAIIGNIYEKKIGILYLRGQQSQQFEFDFRIRAISSSICSMSANVVANDVVCFGDSTGSASIMVSGGTAPLVAP